MRTLILLWLCVLVFDSPAVARGREHSQKGAIPRSAIKPAALSRDAKIGRRISKFLTWPGELRTWQIDLKGTGRLRVWYASPTWRHPDMGLHRWTLSGGGLKPGSSRSLA